MAKESFRRCIVCKKSELKKDLLRFVIREGELSFDRNSNLPGRGAYLHPRAECLKKAGQHKLWSWSLRVSADGLNAKQLGKLLTELENKELGIN